MGRSPRHGRLSADLVPDFSFLSGSGRKRWLAFATTTRITQLGTSRTQFLTREPQSGILVEVDTTTDRRDDRPEIDTSRIGRSPMVTPFRPAL